MTIPVINSFLPLKTNSFYPGTMKSTRKINGFQFTCKAYEHLTCISFTQSWSFMMLSKLQAPEIKGEEALSMGTKRDSLRDKEKKKAE